MRDSLQAKEAQNLLEFCDDMKIETTLIQSKHDAMFGEYMASNPIHDNDMPIRLKRARYSQQFYYVNARNV